nr:hypothetical protein [Tanacetum cinerariifolium]
MSSLFADTHNVVAILKKSDAAEADVTRLQALVDNKKIVISEVVIREIQQLNDAEGIVCLPNEEIFTGLAQMGYEKPSTKLTFYKAFFSSQWKFLIHTILQSLSAKGLFGMSLARRWLLQRVGKGFSGVETPIFKGMLAVRQPTEEGVAEAQVQADDDVAAAVEENVAEDVAHDVIPSPPSHAIPSPSQEQPLPPQQPQSLPQAPPQGAEFPTHIQQIIDVRVKRLERANQVKSLKLWCLRKVRASRRIDSSDDMEDAFNQGRMIDDMDKDEGIELAEIYHIDLDHSFKVLSMQEDDSEVQEVVAVVTTAKLITYVVTAALQVSDANATISAAKPSIPAAALTVVVAYTRKRKGVIIRDLKEELSLKTPAETPKVKDKGKEINKDHEEFNKDIDWDAAMDHVNQKSKNPQYIKRYQGMKKRPQTESEAHKNMKICLKNTAGYKMDFFKGMTYAEICPIFQARFDENMRFLFKSREEMKEEDQEFIKRINETPAQKAAKRRKLSEEAQEAEDLRKRLEVVDDEDDDVFIKATPLARKVPVVNYEIVLINNKPRFKIIKADETYQLYISFTTLLKNFDREDLENLWGIVKERFSTSKPTNFSDEYLLLTLKTMFEKPNEQDAVWKNQKSVHGLALVKSWKLLTLCGVHIITLSTIQLILLVEKRYPLSRFTLEQLVNVTRLQVEEENEMSLELLRFTRQQLQEYQQG